MEKPINKEANNSIQETIFKKNNLVCSSCDLVTTILDTVDALVVILDSGGRIVFFNKACEKLTSYKFKEVEGRCIWELFIVPEEIESVKNVFDNLEKTKFPSKHENYWVTKGGKRHQIDWSNTVLSGSKKSPEYIIGTGVDVTDYKKAEEKVEAHSQELERLNKIMIGRELKMIELKREIERLSSKKDEE